MKTTSRVMAGLVVLTFAILFFAPQQVGAQLNRVSVNQISGILSFAKGGFGFATATLGDLFYASSANTPGKLSDVAVGQVLTSGGVGAAPAYSANPSVTTVTAKGGAGTGTFKAEGVICSTVAGTCSCSAYVSSNVLNQWNAITCSIPASTLSAVGDELIITADFLASNNANNKDIQFVFNGASCGGGTGGSMCVSGTLLASATTATQANSVTAYAKIIKTGSSTQNTFGTLRASTAFLAQSAAAAAATDTGAILVSVGCRNTAAGAACSDAPTPQLTIGYRPQ